MGFGELTGGGEHEVDRGVGRLGQALGAERSDRKGMGKYNVPIGRSMESSLGIRKSEAGQEFGTQQRAGISVCRECEGFSDDGSGWSVMGWSLAMSRWHQP